MANVKMTQDFPVPARTVWDTIGGFNSVAEWHPAVVKSETETQGDITTRTLTLAGGGTIVEKLEKVDDSERSYTYSILSGPLPVADYTATIRVREAPGGCTVEWSSEFSAAGAPESDAVAAIRGVYEAGFENLKRMFSA